MHLLHEHAHGLNAFSGTANLIWQVASRVLLQPECFRCEKGLVAILRQSRACYL